MTMQIAVITRHANSYNSEVLKWDGEPTSVFVVSGALTGYLPAAQGVLMAFDADVIGLLHDDLTLHEDGWVARVEKEFDDPSVAVVGFGGATAIGDPDIYKIPYDHRQLARRGFMSNLRDAEAHGTREVGVRDVAVLDSFALFIRREWLVGVGGWPVDRYAPSHCSDIWCCLKAWQTGKRVRLVGIDCTHTGGGAGADYPAWAATTKFGSDAGMHGHNHRLLYDEFRGLLPLEVDGGVL